jgi:hypothetical protein
VKAQAACKSRAKYGFEFGTGVATAVVGLGLLLVGAAGL